MNAIQEKIIDFCSHITKVSEEFNANSEVPKMKDMELNISIASLSAYVYKELDSDRMERKEARVRKKINSVNLDLNSDKEALFYLFSPELKWSKNGFKGRDGNWINPIEGGFCINSIYEILTSEKKKFTESRKSTRLNSSHVATPYAVFCLPKKKPTLIPSSSCNNNHN